MGWGLCDDAETDEESAGEKDTDTVETISVKQQPAPVIKEVSLSQSHEKGSGNRVPAASHGVCASD